MKKWKLLFIGLLLGAPQLIIAQNKALPVHVENKYQQAIKPGASPAWIEFRKEAEYTAETVFTAAPDLLGISNRDELKLMKVNTDKAGNKHFKFAQFYNGVRVEGVEHMSHERNGKLHLINGNFIPGLNINTTAMVSETDAIEKVLAANPAQIYLWEDEQAEQSFKKKKNDANATLYPTPELLIAKINPKGPETADNYTLVYRMYVFAKVPDIAKYVYVNANTGEILRERSLEHSCNSTTVETTFNGAQLMYTDFRDETCTYGTDGFDYYSVNDCNAGSEIRSNYRNDDGDDDLVCDSDNDWAWVEFSGSGLMTMTSLWAVSEAFKYYDIVHGHESFDGTDGLIDLFSNKVYTNDADEEYCTNANFTSILDNIYFGAGNDCIPGTTDDYNTLDIAGHEFMHGIIEYAHFDALDYYAESGALNESFADIFGEMVEYWIEGGDSVLYLVANDRGTLRSMRDPNDYGDPDTYVGDNWAPLDGDDEGGVHTNSGVQNFMFYLLSEGGSGVNDYGVEYTVEGIGHDKAQDIAWGAMMDYLNAADGYITARNAWIQSAIDLFGSCSQEVISVGQAWQAVGVTFFTGFDVASVCGTYTGIGTVDATYGIENSTVVFSTFVSDCTTTINPFAIINFESGYYITLNPGFEAKANSTFTAFIDECEISEYDPGDLRNAHNIETPENEQAEVLSGFNIFPVPASSLVTIEFTIPATSNTNLFITDLSGRVVANLMENQTLPSGNQTIEFDVQNLPSGIYMAIIKTSEGMQTTKFVVQH
ncbi:MAG: M4 family metallopeptidase [Bacteroidetes bacterium]|nr:M4 family metallopeptidase [Bacteroidota bacterium]